MPKIIQFHHNISIKGSCNKHICDIHTSTLNYRPHINMSIRNAITSVIKFEIRKRKYPIISTDSHFGTECQTILLLKALRKGSRRNGVVMAYATHCSTSHIYIIINFLLRTKLLIFNLLIRGRLVSRSLFFFLSLTLFLFRFYKLIKRICLFSFHGKFSS